MNMLKNKLFKQNLAERRPKVVFHIAGLEHHPTPERYPYEAWNANVLGILNVGNDTGVIGMTTFLNVYADKAPKTTSLVGRSKHVEAKIEPWTAEDGGYCHPSVRFGDVNGVRGAMLPTFRYVIQSGTPLTATALTRFESS